MYRMLGGIPHGMKAFPPFDSSAAASDAEAVADIVLGGFEEAPAVQTEPKRQRLERNSRRDADNRAGGGNQHTPDAAVPVQLPG